MDKTKNTIYIHRKKLTDEWKIRVAIESDYNMIYSYNVRKTFRLKPSEYKEKNKKNITKIITTKK